uniref:Uncharacterized protein n=1 Tax=Oryza rufipogon TaxID=4529 RepID=A0A0E0N244_ORYRU
MGGRRPLLAGDGEPPPPPPRASLSLPEEGARGGGGGGGCEEGGHSSPAMGSPLLLLPARCCHRGGGGGGEWEEGSRFSLAFLAPPSSAIGSLLLLLPARRCRCRRKEPEVGEAAADVRKAATPRRRWGAPSSSSPRVAVAAGKQKAVVAAAGFPSTERSTERGGEKE